MSGARSASIRPFSLTAMSAGFGQFSFILLIPLLVDELELGLASIGAVALWSVLPVYLKGFVQSLTLVGAVTSVKMLTQPLFMLASGLMVLSLPFLLRLRLVERREMLRSAD